MENVQVRGPQVDESTRAHHFTVQSDVRDVALLVVPEGEGWGVSIEGIPDPGIVHDRPWPTVDAARDAALGAIEAMLVLERVQMIEDQKRLEHERAEKKAEGSSG